jgi:hypothetical protein
MTVSEIIESKGISEIVHFTTNHGCLGALYTSSIKSRHRLNDDELVQYLFKPNIDIRKDPQYIDFVSLSIERINSRFYGIASNSWHRNADIFWVVLALDPVIATHEGVIFSNTNNIYTGVARGPGAEGLEALYAEQVVQWPASRVNRSARLSASWPTCEQAEVLYPGEISTEYLKKIYVRSEGEKSEVLGFMKATLHDDVEVVVNPIMFEARAA